MLKSLFGKGDSGKPRALRVGDSVRVKAGIKDEDIGVDLEGWQGRINEIGEKNDIISIALDSITLQNLSDDYISDAVEKGLGWTLYYLGPEDVVLTEARDTQEQTDAIVDELHAKFAWHYLGVEGREISAILAGIAPDDESGQYGRWAKYLSAILSFPFKAEVSEFQERGPLRDGDIIVVQGIESRVGMYGLIAKVIKGRKPYGFPLCDLMVVDEKSSNHDPLQLYAVWFANR